MVIIHSAGGFAECSDSSIFFKEVVGFPKEFQQCILRAAKLPADSEGAELITAEELISRVAANAKELLYVGDCQNSRQIRQGII